MPWSLRRQRSRIRGIGVLGPAAREEHTNTTARTGSMTRGMTHQLMTAPRVPSYRTHWGYRLATRSRLLL